MSTPKITYMGQPVRDPEGRFSSFKAKVKHIFNVVWFWFKMAVAGATLVIGTFAYMTFSVDNTVYAENNTITHQESIAAVMQRIADCESGNGSKGSAHQFNKDGTIVMHENANGSIDIGYMQINLTVAHINKAAKLKMDLTSEEGNKAFGNWIYENEGTNPWMSSSKCWLR